MMCPILILLFQIAACNPNASQASANIPVTGNAGMSKQIDTAYVQTGFYFLSKTQDGIRMRKENSNEIYTITRVPFASASNIIKTELKRTKLKDGIYTELCMVFDAKGTKDLDKGTGNPLHPKIAVVIANKLMYVVDNSVNIKTGVMCIGLVGYSEQEMEAMQKVVDHKR